MAAKLTVSDVRRMLLYAQGLGSAPASPGPQDDVVAAITRMRALQIDTISVVARSPYLVLWSRLGDYDPRWLDELLAEGELFEYWSHEACFLPAEDYPLYRHRMLDADAQGWHYSRRWVEAHRAYVERLLAYIHQRGRSEERGGG